jgi:hypothetical protein
MGEKDKPNVPKKMPIQVGNSNQFVRGVVKLDGPILHIRITVDDLEGGKKRNDVGLARGPFDSFCDSLFGFRASSVYPKNPKGGTRTIDEDVLEPYWLRFRQAYEIWGEDEGLDQFLMQLWQEYRDDQGIEPHPISRKRQADRENFKNALRARLREWKKNKNVT